MSDAQYDDLMFKVEAILFAAGKFMDVEHIAGLVEAEKKDVRKALKALKAIFDERTSSMQIVQEDQSWKMHVVREYVDLVSKIVSDTELSKTVLETLAVVAWKSPILQSEVISIRTSKAYEHIKELVETGYIIKEAEGRSYRLRITEKFFEYFEIMDKNGVSRLFKDVQQAYDRMMKAKRAKAAANADGEDKIDTVIEGDKLGKLKVYTKAVGKDDVITHHESEIPHELLGMDVVDFGMPDKTDGMRLSHLDDPDYIRHEEIKERQAQDNAKSKEVLSDIDAELDSISNRNESNEAELKKFRRVESTDDVEEKPNEEQTDVEGFLDKINSDIEDISGQEEPKKEK